LIGQVIELPWEAAGYSKDRQNGNWQWGRLANWGDAIELDAPRERLCVGHLRPAGRTRIGAPLHEPRAGRFTRSRAGDDFEVGFDQQAA
jgi:hypothetical protein